jgi:CheY-like chemotaxis protein
MKVLVVDDSAAIRSRLATMLRELPDVEVCEVTTADEALDAIRADPPDLVVLDVHMPGRSGLDVLASIKAAPSPPVVVVLTGHPTPHHARFSLARGADYYLDKARDFGRVLELAVVRRR